MPVPFSAVMTPNSLTFTAPSGKTHSLVASDTGFEDAKRLVRAIGGYRAAGTADDDPELLSVFDALMTLVEPASLITAQGAGRVTVQNGVVLYDGVPVQSVLTERILWGLREGYNMQPYIAFMDNLLQNPSHRAVDALLTFVERSKMGITEDGHVLAYKRVRGDFKDLWTGTFDNSPGQIVRMARNQVNDNPNEVCSAGLHVCSQHYLPEYGVTHDGSNTIVIVKINPADFVAVPTDFNASKARVCLYEVLSEYKAADKTDLLASRAVFRRESFRPANPAPDVPPADWADDEPPFAVGDRVQVADTIGLGAADIHSGIIYSVEGVAQDQDGDTVLKIDGRWYDADRFDRGDETEEDDTSDDADDADEYPEPAAPDDTEAADSTAAAARDWGDSAEPGSILDPAATPGASDLTLGPDAGLPIGEQQIKYDRGYESGFAKGVHDASDPAVAFVIPAMISGDVYANGFVDGWVAGMREGRQIDMAKDGPVPASEPVSEPVAASPAAEPAAAPPAAEPAAETLAERDIILSRAEPVQGPLASHTALRFDPVTGLFFLLPGANPD